jgi:iron complex outermembrane receptor protein
VVNGPKIETTGVDMSFNYDFGDVLDGVLTAGIDATYVDKYDQDEFTFGGVFIQEAFDAVGYTNYNRVIQTISEWRAIGHVNYGWGPLNTRYEFRYIDGVDDNRSNPSVYNADGDLVEITYGEEVDEYWSHNLYFVWDAPWDTVLTFSIVNMLDEDPSEARHQLGYDPYIGDPLGRTFEIGFTKTFARNN